MALGAGYPETGSPNESAIHWDLICDLRQGGSVHVDGEAVSDDGRFRRVNASRPRPKRPGDPIRAVRQ